MWETRHGHPKHVQNKYAKKSTQFGDKKSLTCTDSTRKQWDNHENCSSVSRFKQPIPFSTFHVFCRLSDSECIKSLSDTLCDALRQIQGASSLRFPSLSLLPVTAAQPTQLTEILARLVRRISFCINHSFETLSSDQLASRTIWETHQPGVHTQSWWTSSWGQFSPLMASWTCCRAYRWNKKQNLKELGASVMSFPSRLVKLGPTHVPEFSPDFSRNFVRSGHQRQRSNAMLNSHLDIFQGGFSVNKSKNTSTATTMTAGWIPMATFSLAAYNSAPVHRPCFLCIHICMFHLSASHSITGCLNGNGMTVLMTICAIPKRQVDFSRAPLSRKPNTSYTENEWLRLVRGVPVEAVLTAFLSRAASESGLSESSCVLIDAWGGGLIYLRFPIQLKYHHKPKISTHSKTDHFEDYSCARLRRW